MTFTIIFLIISILNLVSLKYRSEAIHNRLTEGLGYFEPVKHQEVSIISTGHLEEIAVTFKAYSRIFQLELTRKFLLLPTTSQVIIHESDDEKETIPVTFFKEFFVTGKESSDPDSYVHGRFYNEMFDGVIHVDSNIYYVEPSSVFFKGPVSFANIIYRHRDVNLTHILCGETSSKKCHPFRIDAMQGLKVDTVPSKHRGSRKRYKKIQPLKICTIKAVAEFSFFENSGHSQVLDTIHEMMIQLEIANKYLKETQFILEGIKSIGLQVKEIEIHKIEEEQINDDMEIIRKLDIFSHSDFSSFCLGVGFVHRTFIDSPGVAFQAELDPVRSGGICQPHSDDMSPNTVVVSKEANNLMISRGALAVILMHALGHSFGSSHDLRGNEACDPAYDLNGKYLMNSDISPKQLKFSNCSIEEMSQIINSRSQCFLEPELSCGNALVEDDEECDCGPEKYCDDIDPCCNPSSSPDGCRVREGFNCTPAAGPCCTPQCMFVPRDAFQDCTDGNDCYKPTFCDGYSGICPLLERKSNNIHCEDGAGFCKEGECEDTACARLQLKRCECSQVQWSCTVCCLNPEDDQCVPGLLVGVMNSNGDNFLLPNNRRCDNGWGVCRNGVCYNLKGREREREREEGKMKKDNITYRKLPSFENIDVTFYQKTTPTYDYLDNNTVDVIVADLPGQAYCSAMTWLLWAAVSAMTLIISIGVCYICVTFTLNRIGSDK